MPWQSLQGGLFLYRAPGARLLKYGELVPAQHLAPFENDTRVGMESLKNGRVIS